MQTRFFASWVRLYETNNMLWLRLSGHVGLFNCSYIFLQASALVAPYSRIHRVTQGPTLADASRFKCHITLR